MTLPFKSYKCILIKADFLTSNKLKLNTDLVVIFVSLMLLRVTNAITAQITEVYAQMFVFDAS